MKFAPVPLVFVSAPVIVLITPHIITYIGLLADASVPARVFSATVRLPLVTLGTIFQFIRNHSGARSQPRMFHATVSFSTGDAVQIQTFPFDIAVITLCGAVAYGVVEGALIHRYQSAHNPHV